MKGEHRLIPANCLKPNELNPRSPDPDTIAALRENIKEVGLLQNLVVTPNRPRPGFYTIIVGEQRWRAASANGESELPCYVIEEIDEEEQILMMLSENQVRRGFTAAQVGDLVGKLKDKGLSLEGISARMGITGATLKGWVNLNRKASPGIKRLLAPIEHRTVPKGKIGTEAAQKISELSVSEEVKDELAQIEAKKRYPLSVIAEVAAIVGKGTTLSATEVFEKAELQARRTKIQLAFKPGKRHEEMKAIGQAMLESDNFKTKVELGIIGTRPDVVGVKGKAVILLECETLRSLLKKPKPKIFGYDVARILVIPDELRTRYDWIWFINSQVQTFDIAGRSKRWNKDIEV